MRNADPWVSIVLRRFCRGGRGTEETMRTFNCPGNDHGICVIPDPAVVSIDGSLSLVRQSAVERLFPESFAEYAREPERWTPALRLPELPYARLIDSVAEDLRSQSLRELEANGVASFGLLDEVRADRLSFARDVAASLDRDGIIATCSCGHTWVT